jgi:hypothetical protein
MGSGTGGVAVVAAKIENSEDFYAIRNGLTPAARVRTVDVGDALVDAGATLLSLPRPMIRQLGLRPVGMRRARTAEGPADIPLYSPVRLTVQDRDCTIEVAEYTDDGPVRIGRIPLTLLDFVVEPGGRRLVGNPDHGGEHMIELY